MPSTSPHRIDLPPFTFWETRSGSGSPIVLIHGLGGSSDWWRNNVPVLAKRHTVAAVDLVGFGRNRLFLRRSRLPLKFYEIAALLGRWIESTFREPVHLVGNSMGGHVAIHLAASRPDLVRSLTLVNSTGIPFAVKPGLHLENLVMPPGIRSFALILARDLFRSGPTALFLAFSRLLRDDARPLLRALRMPVLLLWGESDPLVPLAYAERMREEIAGARLVVVPKAGHIPMWENPQVFNRELLEFVSEVEERQPVAAVPARGSWALSGWTNGIAHRELGRRRDIVLIHGLGMSSAYFRPFANALSSRGLQTIAPDLPGFGESADGPPLDPRQHADLLAAWAAKLSIHDAVWIGHSAGCNAIAHLAAAHPGVVRAVICIGPLWSQARHPYRRLFFDLVLDAFREPWSLFRFVIPAYWRAGLGRWWKTWRRYADDTRVAPPAITQPLTMLAGERDPLVDRERTRELDPNARLDLPGAHACHFSFPESAADAVVAFLQRGA